MTIEINKPIYDYCLKDLIKKAGLNPKHQETDTTDVLIFNMVEGATFAGRLGTTVSYLTEVQTVVNENSKKRLKRFMLNKSKPATFSLVNRDAKTTSIPIISINEMKKL